ncbi:MAG: hypothetical protein R2774_13945 [Saprospiraceae bacterium]
MDNKKDSILKNKQWEVMSEILDKELPVEKKKKRPIIFLLIFFSILGILGIGYFIQSDYFHKAADDIRHEPVIAQKVGAKLINAKSQEVKSDVIDGVQLNHETKWHPSEIATIHKSKIKPERKTTELLRTQIFEINNSVFNAPSREEITMNGYDIFNKRVMIGSELVVESIDSDYPNIQQKHFTDSMASIPSINLSFVKSEEKQHILKDEKLHQVLNVENRYNDLYVNSMYMFSKSNTINNFHASVLYDFWAKGKLSGGVGIGFNFFKQSDLSFYGVTVDYQNKISSTLDNTNNPAFTAVNFNSINSTMSYMSLLTNIDYDILPRVDVNLGYELGRLLNSSVSYDRNVLLLTESSFNEYFPKWNHILHFSLTYKIHKKLRLSANISHNLNSLYSTENEYSNVQVSLPTETSTTSVNTLLGFGIRYQIF